MSNADNRRQYLSYALYILAARLPRPNPTLVVELSLYVDFRADSTYKTPVPTPIP